MLHKLKIKSPFLTHILEHKKNFEVRYNDRDYQVGDLIKFIPLKGEEYHKYVDFNILPTYEIVYIHSEYGLAPGYVILAIIRSEIAKKQHHV